MKGRLLALALLMCVLTSACIASGSQSPGTSEEDTGSTAESAAPETQTADPQATQEEEPQTPEPKYINPLTGLPADEDLSGSRPIAVMLNNLKAALPQYGVSGADIIYEVPAEGGITRMLAIFQSVKGVGDIGSVRSTRPYYLDLAQGLDAILLHAGGSEQAYSDIKTRGVTALDCIRGPYEGTLYWRDKSRIRIAGFEHSVFTSGEKIGALLPTYGIRMTHPDGYSYPYAFAEDGTPKDGAAAEVLTLRYSNYKTGVFTYDRDTGVYLVGQYGTQYIDGATGEQVGVTNVLVLYAKISVIPKDTAGRLTVSLTGSGDGLFFCGGRAEEIRWSKEKSAGPFVYTRKDGSPLIFGAGRSYINIMEIGGSVSYS